MSKNLQKPWKGINQEKKDLKKKYKQEKILKQLDHANKLSELSLSLRNNTQHEVSLEPVSTVSIAVPGSILENAQSVELRTYLAGQIARAACIFRVDEIVVFDDEGLSNVQSNHQSTDDKGVVSRNCCLQFARILQYLECPQYLRKFFFPLHNDLKYSALLNPLDAPHHLRQQSSFLYREGVVTDKKVKNQKGCYVNVGLMNDLYVNQSLTPGVRVTVRIDDIYGNTTRNLKGNVVSPSEPLQKTGVYWGYSVRIAHSVSEVFTKSPYDGGYDLTVGTSDRGTNVDKIDSKSLNFNHALIAFGGLTGLEAAIDNDEKLDVEDASLLFDQYINVLPSQGSRTIRTEEAILVSLSALKDKLNARVPPIEFKFTECIPQSEHTGIKNII